MLVSAGGARGNGGGGGGGAGGDGAVVASCKTLVTLLVRRFLQLIHFLYHDLGDELAYCLGE